METGAYAGSDQRLDAIAEALPQRAGALSRLFLTHTSVRVSRLEASVLVALGAQPRRITELAAQEGVTQPGITVLVNRLQERGWVIRTPDDNDGRAVLVTLTPRGREALDLLRTEYRALLHEEMATLPDRDVRTLAKAIEILDRLIERLREHEPPARHL
jgi:DNA-binding MarR family transcriptional regulator